MTALAPAVESFFTDYLTAQRGASRTPSRPYPRTRSGSCSPGSASSPAPRPSDLDFTDVDAATVTVSPPCSRKSGRTTPGRP